MEKEKIVNELENIILRIRERTRNNDWASSSFVELKLKAIDLQTHLWERVGEINKVIKLITKNKNNDKN